MARQTIAVPDNETMKVDFINSIGNLLFTVRVTEMTIPVTGSNIDITVPKSERVSLIQCWNEGNRELSKVEMKQITDHLPAGATLTISTTDK
jgi:hypothetical protein